MAAVDFSLILSHHSWFPCECNKEEINDDDDVWATPACSEGAQKLVNISSYTSMLGDI